MEMKKVTGIKEGSNLTKNSYGRNYSVSPLFPFKNASTIGITAPDNVFLVDVELDTPEGNVRGSAYKYAPFNNLRIVNSSSSDIIVYPNQNRSQGILVSAGTSQNVDNRAVKAFHYALVENIGASSITAGQVRVLFWKDSVTDDAIIKRVHKALFGGMN